MSDGIRDLWPLLVFFAYLLVTCTLVVLASHRRHAIEMHDRVRRSKQMRTEYLRALEAKRALTVR